jgi:hypothetical protein
LSSGLEPAPLLPRLLNAERVYMSIAAPPPVGGLPLDDDDDGAAYGSDDSDDSASVDCSSTDSSDDEPPMAMPEPEPEPEPEPRRRLGGGGGGGGGGGAARRRPGLQKSAHVTMLERLPSSRELLETAVAPPSVGGDGDDFCDDVCDDVMDPATPPAVMIGGTPPAVGGGGAGEGEYGYVRALVHLDEAHGREEEESSSGMSAWHMDGRIALGPLRLPLALHLEHTDWAGRGLCRLVLNAAVPPDLNAEMQAVDARAVAALNGLADAVLLDVSWAAGASTVDELRADTACDLLCIGSGASALLHLSGISAADYPSEALAARRAEELTVGDDALGGPGRGWDEEEGRWLVCDLVGAMGSCFFERFGEAAPGNALRFPLAGVAMPDLLGLTDADV